MISVRLAGLGSRVLAHILDLVVVFAFLYTLYVVLGLMGLSGGLHQAVVLMSLFLVPLLYFILLEGLWNGQTPGKKAMRLRVRLIDGTPISFGSALLRNVLRPADTLPAFYLLGMMVIFFNSQSRRIGDLAAGTIVCLEPDPEPRFAVTESDDQIPLSPLATSLPPLRRVLRQEYVTIQRLYDRLPTLPPPVAERYLREVWRPFALRHELRVPGAHELAVMEAFLARYQREQGLL